MSNQEDQRADYRADYIAAMAQELAQIARSEGLEPLAYLLDMTKLEAKELAGKKRQYAQHH